MELITVDTLFNYEQQQKMRAMLDDTKRARRPFSAYPVLKAAFPENPENGGIVIWNEGDNYVMEGFAEAGDFIPDVIKNYFDWLGTCRDNTVQLLALLQVNGVIVPITSLFSSYEVSNAYFTEAMADSSRRYRATPEYAAQQERERISLAADQRIIDALLAKQHTDYFICADENLRTARILSWVCLFAKYNDHMKLVYDKDAVAKFLRMCGYYPNANLNLPDEAYLVLSTNTGYVVGQAISMLESGMPIHPLLGNRVVDRWLNMTFTQEYTALSSEIESLRLETN